MEEIDVEDMERKNDSINYQQEIIKNIVKKRIERKQYESENKPMKKINNMIKFNKPKKIKEPKIIKIPDKERKEVYNSFRDSIFEVLSFPMKDPNKKPVFKEKLKNSAFMDRFTRSNIYENYIENVNDKTKFLFVYGYHYVNTMLDNEIKKIDDNKKENENI